MKSKEERKESVLKAKALSDDELASVNGGFTQNSDGTYNIYAGETFRSGRYVFNIEETKLNATLDTHIACEYVFVDENGMLKDWGQSQYTVGQLLKYI